ncbi:hypothetical protein FSP39_022382 [Pinctada imbricata]|uniref:Multiple epidermal growth factor-like domains protein 8 n=1 Tax=Pinctada imbricata TaxID=66713 RepID=A0AA88XNJ5_PINIB|nr:hypothetical protein FSP39_022382 [Pinctada imbricata]
MLELEFIETECSYDYLFVFDGMSHSSPLIASLSGNTVPQKLVATSGHMLLLQFSDRNYELGGFRAKYFIEDCPMGCSSHGVCINFSCYCDDHYVGEMCQYEICPNACSNNGECIKTGDKRYWGCKCSEGYAGKACEVALNGEDGKLTWKTIMPEVTNFTNRLEHMAAYDASSKCIYVYGGFTLNLILSDVQKYCMDRNYWESIGLSDPWPSGRHKHAMAMVEGGFYIFGGLLEGGTHSDELWFYNISAQSWTLCAVNSTFKPLSLSGHSLTYTDSYLYVIGGKTEDGLFSANIFRISANNPKEWENVLVTSNRNSHRLVQGHSAVYHKESNSILIYGGIRARSARYTELSSRLFAFNVQNHYWTEIHNRNEDHSRNNYVPRKRAHHSAVIVGNYMVVYGGYVHIHQEEEKCYDEKVYLYHLGCHQWVNHPLVHSSTNSDTLPSGGRFGHVALVVNSNIMVVVGGYRGHAMGDMISYKFPGVIAPPETELSQDRDYCTEYTGDANNCIKDIECIFCLQRKDIFRPGCTHRTRPEMCEDDFKKSTCHGICSQLSTCQSCLSQGQGVTLTSMSPRRRVYQDECSWCVKNSTCQRRAVPEGSCRSPDGTKSGIQGWWNGLSPSWTDVGQCSEYDIPGGIQWMKYYFPSNLSQPDEVEFLGEIKSIINYQQSPANKQGHILSRYYGYIWPLNAPPVSGMSELKPYLSARGTKVTLNLSLDDTAENLQLVAEVNFSATSDVTIDTHRGNRSSVRNRTRIFPNMSREYKYYFTMEAKKYNSEEVNASIEVQWNADLRNARFEVTSRYLITAEFLEPYHSDFCGNYTNCLQCMTDASCGWCPTTETCLMKGNNSSWQCSGTNNSLYLVTHPTQCKHCPDFVDCKSCVTSQLCEWRPDIQQCFRRGRFNNLAVLNISQCDVPCHNSNFIHGQCLDWIDSEEKDKYYCRDCSMYTDCESCLGRFGCGWCGDEMDRRKGKCVDGDFDGPRYGNCSAELQELVTRNVTLSGRESWAYDKCLDIDECRLGIAECHPNATCHNQEGSYNCVCNQGYVGDGKTCIKTCYHPCGQHGMCSGFPNYTCVCDLGWTGVDCSTDCGCNQQSTCTQGVGVCDLCENNTEGTHCERCKFGYYRKDPSEGCKECTCNGHGNQSMGICNNTTGECYCTDNTQGIVCQRCVPKHYGNPENGGKCYRQCDSRLMLNQSEGSLGLHLDPPQKFWHPYCLWIINIPDDTEDLDSGDLTTPLVSVSVDGIDTQCGRDYVYIYNDVPMTISGSNVNLDDSSLVGSFCGSKKKEFIVRTSVLTVYFNTGFNISWRLLRSDTDLQMCQSGCNYSEVDHSCMCNATVNDVPISVTEYSHQMSTMMMLDPMHEELGRYGHSLVGSGEDTMLMFGGFSLKYGLMNDIWMYDGANVRWTRVTPITSEAPSGRYYHAAVYVPILKVMYVYGGLMKDDIDGTVRASQEFWKFSIGPRMWTKLDVPSDYNALAGHTMNLVDDTTLILIGGFSSESYFNDKVYMYDTKDGLNGWQEPPEVKGAVPIGLYGHTTVYHRNTETLYIYGGMVYKGKKFGVSSDLLTFDVPHKRFSYLQAEKGSQRILARMGVFFSLLQNNPRLFHTAVDAGDYMMVFGGTTSHDASQTWGADSVLIYRYSCNYWHKLHMNVIPYRGFMTSLLSPKAVVVNGNIYLIGGFEGHAYSNVIQIQMPEDICNLIGPNDCNQATGCLQCLKKTTPGALCYSSDKVIPTECSSSSVSGTPCNLQWYKDQNCTSYTECHSCTATYPFFKHENMPCSWCGRSGSCISSKEEDVECGGSDSHFLTPQSCVDNPCMAADCTRCSRNPDCIWTNRFNKSGEQITIGNDPIYNWNCFKIQTNVNDNLDAVSTCSPLCHQHSNCKDCLRSPGIEGGSRECVWSFTLQQCLPPAYLPIRCSGGECGTLLQYDPEYKEEKCPIPCTQHFICAECVKAPGCGWCAFGGQNGEGACMQGGIEGPKGDGKCTAEEIRPDSGHLTLHQGLKAHQSKVPPSWNYMVCPAENECKNTHHNCDNENQDCFDTEDSFNCTCKDGYIEQGNACTPVCHNACKKGRCIKPDKCQCNFGWVGDQCDKECQCHGHSSCLGEDRLDHCKECMNNTQGAQCEFCKPSYVGNPKKDDKCDPCFVFCNNHTENCGSATSHVHSNYLKDGLNGPTRESASCQNCMNNTAGQRCEQCKPGFFRVDPKGNKKHEACMKCQCNGHSDMCDPNTGENCQCKNNTDTPCHLGTDKDSSSECWRRQCSKCKDFFLGMPVNGHHCYRQMDVDLEYCLDPTTQSKCISAAPLLKHRTVFFAVQPRYLNVDIRITLDITQGGVDVYFSANERTFIVTVDKPTGIHRVSLDRDLMDVEWTDNNDNPIKHVRRKRSVRNSTSGLYHNLYEMHASDFHTYQTVKQTKTILKVLNIRSRLVITLPLELHDLRTSRFYMVLYGVGSEKSNETLGNLYFRQDQPHIDLFVFFSVFFSSFFLFLAKCVLLWKLKQAIDAQRNRQRQQKEMAHMASRPFAKVLVLIEPEQVIYSSTPVPRRRTKLPKINNRAPSSMMSLTPVETFLPPPIPSLGSYNTNNRTIDKIFCPFSVIPIATEPLANGTVSLRTIALQLPGGNSAPSKLCLASALTVNSKTFNAHAKTGVRQRLNQSSC